MASDTDFVPGPVRNFKATPGDKVVLCTWAAPKVDATHGKADSYYIKCSLMPDGKLVSRFVTENLSQKFTGLVDGVEYKFEIIGINYAYSPTAHYETALATPVPPPPAAVHVTMTGIGPDKVPNTRAGQSLADAPTVVVKGTNLTQPWAVDAAHSLAWVLYTDSTWAHVVGTDAVSVMVSNESTTQLTITTPVAPGNADVDTNMLIGPWRLKATYAPDPTNPASTATAYSPALYTTAVGTVIVGTVSPDPMRDGDLVTVTGPDVGVCDRAIVTLGGVAIATPLTRVDQNSATFRCPTFGFQLDAAGDLVLEYTLNGNVLSTPPFSIQWDVPVSGLPDGGSTYEPPTGVDITSGDMNYPAVILRWVFRDASGVEPDWTVPRNPDAMTSPFPTRNVQSKFTTAITGQALLTEGAPQLAQWEFSGTVADARHYEKLRHWVEDRNARTIIIDHFGRVIECVLLNFNPTPKRDIHRYWSHTYKVTAIVLRVGAPTAVPA